MTSINKNLKLLGKFYWKGGYHSVELMLIQMESQSTITDNILKDELWINN